MSKLELKELIYDLEDILKLDKRFKKNGDNKYKKNIKAMYIKTLLDNNKFKYIQPLCPPVVIPSCPTVEPPTCPTVEPPTCPTVEKSSDANLSSTKEIYEKCLKILDEIDESLGEK